MKIGIIDADLLGRDKHHFPNLACEKISGYWKAQGAEVKLLMDYTGFENYDHVYVSKVFTDTPVPIELVESEKLHIGGTGFYFDKAPNLPDEIEHHMPDYRLYDEWIDNDVKKHGKAVVGVEIASFEEIWDKIDTILVSNRLYYNDIKEQVTKKNGKIKVFNPVVGKAQKITDVYNGIKKKEDNVKPKINKVFQMSGIHRIINVSE